VHRSFLRVVKPTFDAALEARGYRLIHAEESESFGNGILIYQSDQLRIQVTRDRGQILLSFRGVGHLRDYDDEILQLLVDGTEHYQRRDVNDFSVEGRVAFLRRELGRIEALFAPAVVDNTARAGSRLQEERANALFGPVET